jgi:hypothetical protein
MADPTTSTSTSAATEVDLEDGQISSPSSSAEDDQMQQPTPPSDPDYGPPTREQILMYKSIRTNRYASPQAFVQSRFARIQRGERTNKKVSQQKLDPRSLEYVASLWDKQRGRCALTGYALEWTEEAYRCDSPYMASTMRITRDLPYGVGNAMLVCECVKRLVASLGGVDAAIGVAKEARRFIEFKHAHPRLSTTEACALWDIEESKRQPNTAWIGLTDGEYSKLEHTFLVNHRKEEARSPRSEQQFACHCAGLYEGQRGRCAITGIRMRRAFGAGDPWGPSADRIDNSLRHIPGNAWITPWVINSGRGNTPADAFSAMLCAIALRAP